MYGIDVRSPDSSYVTGPHGEFGDSSESTEPLPWPKLESLAPDTLDEAPAAYKPMAEILQYIRDTVDVVEVIRPVYNFKAAED